MKVPEKHVLLAAPDELHHASFECLPFFCFNSVHKTIKEIHYYLNQSLLVLRGGTVSGFRIRDTFGWS
jgi:hypothetical protein